MSPGDLFQNNVQRKALKHDVKICNYERIYAIMKVITFATMKGGSGKTTITFNLAAQLAKDSKVLLIDFDAQCNLSSNFKFDIFDENIPTVANIFEKFDADPLDIIIYAPISELPNLDFMPSTMYLYGTELSLASRSMREQVMQNYMEKNKKVFEYYDYVIFDTAPNMGIINQNAFFVSDHIILVSDPSVNSAQGANIFLILWGRAREYTKIPDHVDGFIINNVERTKILDRFYKYVNTHPVLSKIQFKEKIPHTTRFRECDDSNLPIQLLQKKNKKDELSRLKAEQAIERLVEEMKERGIL